ncbi:alpha/beta fold hydrolase [Nocardioides humi]|uniref:Alpha/beta fold hydrolase n=1 Tax=Nocardioides humi TaxID=449461 RepID=A0ABN2ADX9_9ACTN|nr:alpha/beta hydrolase [Nocardioides humi]
MADVAQILTVPALDGDGVLAGHYFAPRAEPTGVLLVAVHGGTYDHRYWNAPSVGGVRYSFAEDMTARGHGVVAVDQLGVAASRVADPDAVTIAAAAEAISALVARARSELADQLRLRRVALLGHSIGSIVSVWTQATHHPADLLVTTGIGHVPLEDDESPFGPGVLEEALQHPWVDLPPAARKRAFYDPRTADPAVVELDNASLRSVFPRQLLLDAVGATTGPELSRVDRVEGPVCVVLADRDPIAPAALADRETAPWAATGDVEVHKVSETGHCYNLHPTNVVSWDIVHDYVSSRV